MDAVNGGAAKALRVFAAALFAAVLVVGAAIGAAPGTARADDLSGYVTISGVVGVDEAAVYGSFAEAVAVVASCDVEAQADDPASAVLVIHGTVTADAQSTDDGTFNLHYPVDGSAYAIVGADGAARLNLVDSAGSGRAPVLSNRSGSLVVRGVDVDGPIGLTCRDNLGIDGSTFNAPVSCAAGGSVTVTGNIFSSSWASPTASLYVELRGAGGSLSFAGNRVSGYAAGLSVKAHQGSGVGLSVTSNVFALDAAAAGYGTGSSYVVSLGGGPWAPASIACDGNAVEGSRAFFVLEGSCSVSTGSGVESVADGTLSADAVIALFELAGLGSAGAGDSFAAVSVTPSYRDTAVAAQIEAASNALAPGSFEPAPAEALPVPVTVAYDGNGATAGEAPGTVGVDSGQPVTVAHMGSLISAGCVFSGWNTAPDGSGVFYAAGQVIWPESDLVLYAQWVPNGTVGNVAVAEQHEDWAA